MLGLHLRGFWALRHLVKPVTVCVAVGTDEALILSMPLAEVFATCRDHLFRLLLDHHLRLVGHYRILPLLYVFFDAVAGHDCQRDGRLVLLPRDGQRFRFQLDRALLAIAHIRALRLHLFEQLTNTILHQVTHVIIF